MKQFSNIMAVVGTIIGAGFVTGKEIACFFSRFGFSGIYSSLFLFPFFAVAISIALCAKTKLQIIESQKKMQLIFFVANVVISLAMVSASFFVLKQLVPINQTIIASVLICIQFVVLIKGIKGFSLVCSLLIPALICFLICISAQSLHSGQIFNNLWNTFQSQNAFCAVWFCIIYVASNFLVGYTIFGKIGLTLSKKQISIVATISALIISAIIMLFNVALLNKPNSIVVDMPVFYLISQLNPTLIALIQTFALFGMLTTLFATQQSMTQILETSLLPKAKKSTNIVAVCALSFIGFLINFALIVEQMYPVLGIIGLFVFVYCVILLNNKKVIS